MTHLFINALSATAGGGLTYVRNVLPSLAEQDDAFTTLLVGEELRQEVPDSARVRVLRQPYPAGPAARFWYEQGSLPGVIRNSGADVLLSTGNFALFRSPVPQILLSRNALYTSADFLRDLRQRGDYGLWIDTVIKGFLARWSVQTADCTVAPSETFATELRTWTGKDVLAIHHGFNRAAFFSATGNLAPDVQARLNSSEGALRLLFVSHYNYFRNFETLIRSLSLVKRRLHPRKVRLFLTCQFAARQNPGSYRADAAAALVESLNLREEVVELGAVPYSALHHLYRGCDVYVSPAYAETFAHPLVEAMASGLPVLASDLAVHREICGEAALYFARFSPQELADRILQLSASKQKRLEMTQRGLLRSQDFSWDKHVAQLLLLARRLTNAAPVSVEASKPY